MSTDVARRIYDLLCAIPKGRVTTYGELARAVGSRAPRAIGRILHINPNAPRVPCHRVVMSDGTLGGYAGGCEKKIALLNSEGVHIEGGAVVDFSERFFRFDHKNNSDPTFSS